VIDGVLELELPGNSPDQAWSGLVSPFVVGPENALLVAPIRRLLDGDDLAEAAEQFNPLVLVGGSGSGKSQLAQAIIRHWRGVLQHSGDAADADENVRVQYFTAADFGRELEAASKEGRLGEWQARVRSLKLLVIEDLQRLRRQDPVQQELRFTIDAVMENGGVVVVTAQCEPAMLRHVDLGLRDRLSAGLLVRLQSPGRAAREAILRHEASAWRVVLSDDQVAELARRDAASAAELRGRVADFGRLAHPGDASTRINHPSSSRGGEKTEWIATLKQIIAVTSRYFAVTQAALTGPSRRTSLVLARNIVVHLARRHTDLSYAEIGRALGGRDHTTIMHADRRLTERLAQEADIQQTLDELDRLVR
jgi:chromosomal replication initiator protein